MKQRLVVGGVLLLGLALAFNMLFSWSALDEFYLDSIHSRITASGQDLQQHLNRFLPAHTKIRDESSSFCESHRVTKDMPSLADAGRAIQETERLLHRTLRVLFRQFGVSPATALDGPTSQIPLDMSVSVASPDGRLVYSTDGSQVDHVIPPSHRHPPTMKRKNGSTGPEYLKTDGMFIVPLPVQDAGRSEKARIILTIPGSLLSKTIQAAHIRNLLTAAAIFLVAAIVLVCLLKNPDYADVDPRKPFRRRISLIIFLVTASAQLVSSGFSILAFTNFAWSSLKAETEMTSQMFKDVLERRAEAPGLERAHDLIDQTMESGRKFSRIRLLDKGGRLIHQASLEAGEKPGEGLAEELRNLGRAFLNLDLVYESTREINPGGEFAGFVTVVATPPFMYDRLLKVIADALTVALISILFLVELMVLVFQSLASRTASAVEGLPKRPEIMRPAAFLFVFGIDISVSFLPLHMKNLYQPVFGLSRDFVLGLPISVEFVFVGLTILIAGVWVDRRGWHEPFLLGLALAGGGVVYSWLAPDSVHFIISRALAGAGYGLSLMASQAFVIHFSERNCKAHGLAQLFAGIYAGSICGSATGAMLAERFGYETVFAVGAAVIMGTLLYTILYMRGYMRRPFNLPAIPRAAAQRSQNSFAAFMLNRTVISLIFFSSLPAAIGVVGFLNYFSPIYLSSIGASQSTIGRVLMIYGISLIYLGPYISRYVDASNDKRGYVFTGCLLGSMTFLSFYFFQGIWAAVIGVLLLGLSSSFVLASQSAYVLQLPVTQALGEGKAIGIFRSSSRIGQALGPMVFSAVMAGGDTGKGIIFFGLMYLLTAFLFLLMNQKRSRASVLQEVGGF